MDLIQPHQKPPCPPLMWTVFFVLYQLWHISWKEGKNMNGGLSKKTGDIGLSRKPLPLALHSDEHTTNGHRQMAIFQATLDLDQG